MEKTFLLSVVNLDQESDVPLYRQICRSLQQGILTQQLAPGLKLPSTRDLAQSLGVSRNTVVNALEHLIAEGYIETRPKSGSFVTETLPDEMLSVMGKERPFSTPTKPQPSQQKRCLSDYAQRLASVAYRVKRPSSDKRTFTHGMPAFEHFPFDLWARLINKQYRSAPLSLFSDNSHSAGGYRPLREAIAEHVRVARGVRCEAEQVMITSGSQQGVYIAAKVLLNVGDAVWFEEPGYLGARGTLASAGAKLIPVPVDSEGLNVSAGEQAEPNARVAFITPSHQFPLGRTMSLTRRLQLLAWAERAGAWIIEDDYDSEYRYCGHPIAALQGLDVHERVIYVGTFSKVMLPTLRIGYLIVPPDLVDPFLQARYLVDLQNPVVPQAALAEFIAEGHFANHLRRMRMLYGERLALFEQESARLLGGRLMLDGADAGMHLVGFLPEGVQDTAVFEAAQARGIESIPLSSHYLTSCPRGGLIMGYTAEPEHIRAGMAQLAQALEDVGV